MRAHVVALKDGLEAFESELNGIVGGRAPQDLVDLKLCAAAVDGVVTVVAVIVTEAGVEF